MKREKLLRAFSYVDEKYLELSPERGRWGKWCALAACLCLVAGGVWFAAAHLGGAAGGGAGEGLSYMSYAGPVFPLTTLEEAPGLTARRSLNFDFSPYITVNETYEVDGEEHSYDRYESESVVTDSYVLENPTGREATVTVVYPFAATLRSDATVLPQITVDGAKAEIRLLIGPYTGAFEGAWGGEETGSLNRDEMSNWQGYRVLVEGGYLERALDPWPVLDQRAIVYELSDRTCPQDADGTAPTLNMAFSMDYEKTVVLSYGMNGGTNDPETGYCARHTWIPREMEPDYGESAYLIVLGEDIGAYTLTGYQNGGCKEGEELEGASAKVSRYETTLGEILERLDRQYSRGYGGAGEAATILDSLPRETFLGAVGELMEDYGLLSDAPVERYDFGAVEDLFSEAGNMGRILYVTFPVTVPAGGRIEVTASMVKEASMDFVGRYKERNGYDMVTRLGSTLTFTEQTASLSHEEEVEIVSQNFGFDPEKGITRVALDLEEEHYYLEVRKRGKK